LTMLVEVAIRAYLGTGWDNLSQLRM